MRILLKIADVRKYRQLGKQSDGFDGFVRTIQQNQLTELLTPKLTYDFFNFLETGFTNFVGTFEYISETQFRVVGVDVSSWTDYSLRINNEVFVIVKSAVFDAVDTIVTITGYDLPATITTVDFSLENKYIKLLNGTVYDSQSFEGLRPFLSWNFISAHLTDGSLKQSDVGNFNILGDNFQRPGTGQINEAKSDYSQNILRENNKIIAYLNFSDEYDLWISSVEEDINGLSIFML